jgi:LmbE family N-acetylglucosaminyl deacetylase
MNILVIAAHPDDEVLGCGGTIARLAAEGARVSILILANGLTSREDFDTTRQIELLNIHHERARRAAALLGATEVSFGSFPDQKMDTVPLLHITQAIEREISRVRPHTIFTQHGGDLNMDHVITYRATLTATRPMQGRCVNRVLSYEVASSTEWSFQKFEPGFRPTVFFDINGYLDLKVAAMKIYESEMQPFPHPRSAEALRAGAMRWGSAAGMLAAEAFELVREVNDLSPILP